MASFKRLKVGPDTPLVPGFYEFVGEVEGSPERASKTDIESYLRRATRLGTSLDVIDWVKVSSTTWRVQLQIKAVPPTRVSLDEGTVQIAVAPVVWVVGILVAALLTGYGIWASTKPSSRCSLSSPKKTGARSPWPKP